MVGECHDARGACSSTYGVQAHVAPPRAASASRVCTRVLSAACGGAGMEGLISSTAAGTGRALSGLRAPGASSVARRPLPPARRCHRSQGLQSASTSWHVLRMCLAPCGAANAMVLPLRWPVSIHSHQRIGSAVCTLVGMDVGHANVWWHGLNLTGRLALLCARATAGNRRAPAFLCRHRRSFCTARWASSDGGGGGSRGQEAGTDAGRTVQDARLCLHLRHPLHHLACMPPPPPPPPPRPPPPPFLGPL